MSSWVRGNNNKLECKLENLGSEINSDWENIKFLLLQASKNIFFAVILDKT